MKTINESKYRYIDGYYAIARSSIEDLSCYTQDIDERGYLLKNGTQRGLAYGVTDEGVGMIWMTTDGDPALLYEGDDTLDWFETLGDAPGDRDIRIRTGIKRLRDAIKEVIERHPDALDDMDFFNEQADLAEKLQEEIVKDVELSTDRQARLETLAEQATGLRYDSPEATSIFDQEDWSEFWPEVDRCGVCTGQIIDAGTPGDWCNVDDVAMVSRSELTQAQRATVRDGCVDLFAS